MPQNLDNIILTSDKAALKNNSSDEFTLTISGVVTPGTTGSWSASIPFESASQLVRILARQSFVPAGLPYQYSANSLLPCPPWGTAGNPNMYVACFVDGEPSVSFIDIRFIPKITNNTLTVTVTIHNPYPGNVTLTPTTFTIRYVAFLPTQ